MFTTSVFSYIPREIVVTLNGDSPRKFMPQYSKPLALQKGVDNQIQFQVLNQDQKPINLTGKPITCRILNYDGTKVLLKKALDPVYIVTGIMSLNVSAAEIEDIAEQKAYYSLEMQDGSKEYPIFMDQNSRARGEMNIVDSVLPSFVPSTELTIPTNQSFPDPENNQDATYYSSVLETTDNHIVTLQLSLSEYSGNVVIQGSTDMNDNWYSIETHDFIDSTVTNGYTMIGFHPYMRVEFNSQAGTVEKILAR